MVGGEGDTVWLGETIAAFDESEGQATTVGCHLCRNGAVKNGARAENGSHHELHNQQHHDYPHPH